MYKINKLVVSSLLALTLYIFPLIKAAHASVSPILWEQKGITIRLVDESVEDVNRTLNELAETGANYVTVTPGWHTDNLESANVDRKSRTPADELLVYTIEKSHEMGLEVFIKPHVDPKTGEWRAKMDPTNKAEFFKNYKNMLMHYAVMSEQYNVEQFAIGSELFKLSTNPENEVYWRDIIASIRQVYSGKLTYNANVGNTSFDESVLPFWDELDFVGFSMYQPLSESTEPTMEELLLNWKILDKNYIESSYLLHKKPVLFTEIGYRSMDGAAIDPGDYKVSAKVDLEEQKLLYEALFSYWQNKDYVIGLHLWDWKVYENPGGIDDIDYTPQNKPALDTLAIAFGGTLDGMVSNDEISEEISDTIKEIEQNEVPKLIISEGLVIYEGKELAKLKEPKAYDVTSAEENSEQYIDRDYTLKNLPEMLVDSVLIKTKNSDKNLDTASNIIIDIFDNAYIFTAYDIRADKLPDWLKNWTALDTTIDTSDTSFSLFGKKVEKGEVILGGNKNGGETGAKSNYFAFITKYTDKLFDENMVNTESDTPEAPLSTDTENTDTQNIVEKEELIQDVLGAINSKEEEVTLDLPDNSVEVEIDDNSASLIQGSIVIEYPENAAVLSGEKKLKVKIPGISRELYTARANVDNFKNYTLEDSKSDDIKQTKIQYGNWDWNGSGPYLLEVIAEDLEGNIIDTKTITLFVK